MALVRTTTPIDDGHRRLQAYMLLLYVFTFFFKIFAVFHTCSQRCVSHNQVLLYVHVSGTSVSHYYRGCSPVIHSGKVVKCDVTVQLGQRRTLQRCLCNTHLCNHVTSLPPAYCHWLHYLVIAVILGCIHRHH